MRPTKDIGARLAEESLRAKAVLEKQGLHLAPKPKFSVPEVPTRITEMDDKALMNLFVRHTRWRAFLTGQLALAEVDERFAEDHLKILEAKALIRDWGGSKEDRVAVARAERMNDPDVQDAMERVQGSYATRKLVSAMVDAADKNAALISRELTRRVGMEPTERRDRRWSP